MTKKTDDILMTTATLALTVFFGWVASHVAVGWIPFLLFVFVIHVEQLIILSRFRKNKRKKLKL